eukprot:scaffold186275_cov36-Prasinocladus_malaysianus.AAC.1
MATAMETTVAVGAREEMAAPTSSSSSESKPWLAPPAGQTNQHRNNDSSSGEKKEKEIKRQTDRQKNPSMNSVTWKRCWRNRKYFGRTKQSRRKDINNSNDRHIHWRWANKERTYSIQNWKTNKKLKSHSNVIVNCRAIA